MGMEDDQDHHSRNVKGSALLMSHGSASMMALHRLYDMMQDVSASELLLAPPGVWLQSVMSVMFATPPRPPEKVCWWCCSMA